MNRKIKILIATSLTISCILGSGPSLGTNPSIVFAKECKTNFEVSKMYSGFKLINKKYIKDVASTVYEFEHEKTGAKLIYFENNDNNKTFGITFKTLPYDNTGVNHIIEHSLLETSKVKLGNPYTGSDFTQYYTFTQKEDNFQNQVGACLDNMFLHKPDEMTFLKHGWRYEINSPNEEMKINGIVYNEMKGKDSATGKLMDVICESLVPNTIYKFDSGGNPADIPKLTYKQFLETYNKNYTPSNSLIYLYGNMNIEKTLEHINSKYLSKLDKVDFNNEINEEKPFDKMKYAEDYYPVPIGSTTQDATYLSMNYLTGKYTDYETKIGLEMLDSLLMSESSPLKKSFLNNKLGSPFCCFSEDQQLSYSLIVINSNESQKEKFVKAINDSLNDIVKNGFNKQLVNSVINSYEMDSRSNSLSQNSWKNYMNNVRSAWLYKGDILGCLERNSQIEKIKEKSKNRYFEKLIEKYLLNNKNASVVILKPKPGLEEENAKKLTTELDKFKSSLSKEELNNVINKNKELKKWQEESSKLKDTKEEVLSLEDINKKSEEIPTDIKKIKDITVLKHPMYANGLQYANLYYDTNKVPQDKLMYLMLLTKFLGKVDTENYNHDKLINDINTYTRGISFDAYASKNSKNKVGYYPKLQLSFTSLNNNLDNVFVLLDEITNKSKFEDKSNLRNLIKNIKSNIEFDLEQDCFNCVTAQALSYASDYEKYNNLKCIPFYQFVCELDKNFDKKSDEIIKNLYEVKNLAFNKENLIVSYTGESSEYNNFEKNMSNFLDKIKNDNLPVQKYNFDYSVKNEAFTMPSKVQYAVKAGDFRKLGYENSGNLAVLKEVLGEYLTREIRGKGGAYGGNAIINNASVLFYSYRDPNLKETIDTFNNSGNFLRNFTADKNKMIKYITKAMYFIDYPREPINKGLEGDDMYITGGTQKDIQRYRDEVLSTTADDIRGYADMVDAIMKDTNLCVIGNTEKLNSEKGLFQVIKSLFED